MGDKPSKHAIDAGRYLTSPWLSPGEICDWLAGYAAKVIQARAVNPEVARYRKAVAELARVAEQGLKRMRELRDLSLDDDLSLSLVVLADDIDMADCALEHHAPLIQECQKDG